MNQISIPLDPILIGSRKYNVNEDDSDYDYILIIPESKVSDILSLWKDGDIREYVNSSSTLPLEISYRIQGISNREISEILHIPENVEYDLLLIIRPDNISNTGYIMENVNLYHMINIYTKYSSNMNIRKRLKLIRKWTKSKGIYGGFYPDGFAYLIYVINTFKKGYTDEMSLKMLGTRCLYSHEEFKYKHISYVSDNAFKHIHLLCQEKDQEEKYQYQIISTCMNDVLKLGKKLCDDSHVYMYISQDGVIHSSSDISDDIQRWKKWLEEYHIFIDIK